MRELARAIAANAPLTVLGVQGRDPRGVARRRPIATGHWSTSCVEACFRSEDYLEGQAAFREKRDPRFRGL